MEKDEGKSGRRLIRKAWDFVDVPSDEIEPCYLYEYGKESPRIICEVTASLKRRHYAESDAARIRRSDWFRSNPKPSEFRAQQIWEAKSLREIGDTITRTKLDYEIHFLVDLADNQIFPEKYWLEIDSDRRRKLLFRFSPDRFRWGSDPASMETRRLIIQTLQSFLEFRQTPLGSYLSDVEHPNYSGPQVFDACWARSDNKLLRDFAEWLKNNRPKDQPGFQLSPHGASRRTTPKDLLKALSAFRLIRHFKGRIQAAKDYYHLITGTFLYKDDSAWTTAKEKAEREIRRFDNFVK